MDQKNKELSLILPSEILFEISLTIFEILPKSFNFFISLIFLIAE